MSSHLQLSDKCREVIWNVFLITLGLKAGDLLFGRHIDQLIMCAIYGVCKIHANGQTDVPVFKSGHASQNIKFQDIIEAYKEIHKARLQKSGRFQLNLSQSKSVSWVFVQVVKDPENDEVGTTDIIEFYNTVYLHKMKAHLLATKRTTLEQGSRTPVLN